MNPVRSTHETVNAHGKRTSNGMNALFISNDPSLLDKESSTVARMKDYAFAIGTLHILTGARKASEFHDGTLHIYGVPCNKFTRVGALSRRAHVLITKEHIEVVSTQDPFEHGLAGMRAIRGTKAKLHVQVHTDVFSPWFVRDGNIRAPVSKVSVMNRVRLRLASRVLPRAHGIRVVSKRIKTSLIARFGDHIVEPVVIPIQVPSVLPPKVALPSRPFTFTLITVSRLEPEKRIVDVLQAVASIHAQYPSVGLVIVGEGGERKRLEHMAHRLGISGNVLFMGERPDAVGLMQSAEAYIQASAYEGYGRTLIEAALSGIPIITTDVGVVGELLRGYQEVLVAPVADPSALAVHIVGLVADAASRIELSLNARTVVQEYLATHTTTAKDIARDLARLV